MKKSLILLIFFSVIAISCQTTYKSVPSLLNNTDKGVGILGPIILNFPKSIQVGSIEKGLRIEPPVEIKFQWQGTRLNIYPNTFFGSNQEYQILLQKDALPQNEKQPHLDYSWKIKTHPECLIYLGSATISPEIWKICLGINTKSQLSRSQGKIFDFNTSDDGNWITYTIQNDLAGTDIWLMDRNGGDNHFLYRCDQDFCREPSFSSDGLNVAFILTKKNNKNLSEEKNDEILLVNITSAVETKLITKKRIKATFLQWSTDKKYISFFDNFSSSFWIWNLVTNQIIELPSSEGLGGFWKRNEDSFIFANLNYWGGIPYGQIYQWDEKTATIQHLFGDEYEPNEYFSPQWDLQSKWILVAYRPLDGSASKQVVVFSGDRMQKIIVTNEQAFSYSSFSWSLDGEMIAFQRFQIGLSGSIPEIGLWRMSDRSNVILEKNASSPKWLP